MSCLSPELLSALVDDELSELERARGERHLFQCQECRDAYRELRALQGFLRQEEEAVSPPMRLELSLSRLAERFVQEEVFVEQPEAPVVCMNERQWSGVQLAIAVALVLLAVVGMGLFAPREGRPTLTALHHPVPELGAFGQAAFERHLSKSPRSVVRLTSQGRAASALSIGYELVFEHPRLGQPHGVKMTEVYGEQVMMVDYRFNGVEVSLFALPLEVALARLGLEPEKVPMTCTAPRLDECFQDGVGTSLCVNTAGDLARIWVAHIPLRSLDKLVDMTP